VDVGEGVDGFQFVSDQVHDLIHGVTGASGGVHLENNHIRAAGAGDVGFVLDNVIGRRRNGSMDGDDEGALDFVGQFGGGRFGLDRREPPFFGDPRSGGRGGVTREQGRRGEQKNRAG